MTAKISKKAIAAWCLFDWANSAFPTMITTFIFAAYFTEKIAQNNVIGTAQWGNATALAGLIIALVSPIVGAIADQQGRRKPWLAFFTLLMVIATSLLWLAKPSPVYVSWALSCVVIGTIGFEIGTVFYNAMLLNLAPEGYLGRISGWAWGIGYAGGLACLVLALVGFINTSTPWFHLNIQQAEHLRIAGPLTAVWFTLFALPLFLFTPDQKATGISYSKAISQGIKILLTTLRSLPSYKDIMVFLLAQMIYSDGLNTLFAFGGIYAAGTFGMSFSEIIQFGIALNLGAGVGAIAFAWLDDLYGAKRTILGALAALLVTSGGLLLVQSKLWFWILAILLSLFIGPVQAASRSLMVRLAPKELVTEMFGLYALSGKATAFIGPWLLGLLTVSFNSQRVGMTVVLLLLFMGGCCLLWVNEPGYTKRCN